MLIIRCIAEKKDIFHTHSLITDSNVKFVYEIYLSYKLNEFRGHQQSNLIEETLNESCFEDFIIKVVMLNDNAQKLSIIFLKIMILLFTGLQFKLSFHN